MPKKAPPVKPALTRSEMMARVKARNTKPEITVRRLLHRLGYRYRLHGRGLPGRPDIVFARRRAAVFVHGCFWHGHRCARGGRTPKTNVDYWGPKLARNRKRDGEAEAALAAAGWRTLTVWECELADEALPRRLAAFLGTPRHEPAPHEPPRQGPTPGPASDAIRDAERDAIW